MRLRTIGSIFILSLLQALLITSTGQAEEPTNVSVVLPAFGESISDQSLRQCSATILIQGGGSVQAQSANNRIVTLDEFNNKMDLDCSDSLNLTAVPSSLWRFEQWEDASGASITSKSIQLTKGQTVKAIFRPEGLYYETVDIPYYDRSGQLTNRVPHIWPPAGSITEGGYETTRVLPPSVTVWYGDTQNFDQMKLSQKYVNIMGNVLGDISSLKYSLNDGSEVNLNIGKDNRRLANPGDFNVDIQEDQFIDGDNNLVITATDSSANSTDYPITINFAADDSSWPLPQDGYYVDWDKTENIQDAAQIVDGHWDALPDSATNTSIGYDRVIAVGGQDWVDYEALVPFHLVSVSPEGFDPINYAPAIGIIMHWTGHTDDPVVCGQPKCGWLPAIASWYEWDQDENGNGKFSMWLNHNKKWPANTDLMLSPGGDYFWKIRAEGSKAPYGEYKMKVWASGADEPDWQYTLIGTEASPDRGSILLLAHYTEVIFGNVDITPLNAVPDTIGPVISNVSVAVEPHGATVQWKTDEPATSVVNFGDSASYDQSVESSSLETDHFVYLDDLQAEKLYHFEISSTDPHNNLTVANDDTFTTQELIALVSDDFNYCELDPAWEFINPQNDSSYVLTTTELDLFVPSGTSHDIWAEQGSPLVRVPRIMREVTDPNNLQVKFASGVGSEIEFQGVMLQENSNELFRVSYQYTDGNTELYVIGHNAGKNSILKKLIVSGASPNGPLYLWITRESGRWHVRYSLTGNTWSDAGIFNFPISVYQGGIFAGNVAGPQSIPAVHSQVDYWFNAGDPINPEDNNALILPVTVQGNGSVTKSVECGNPVTLTATPNSGWHFVRWEGSSIDGQTNSPIAVTFDFGDAVTAVFEENLTNSFDLTTAVVGAGGIVKDPDKSVYDDGESVTLTAVENAGWKFDHWEGALSGANNSQTLIMNSNKSVTAVFVEKVGYDLQLDIVGNGKVLPSPDKEFYDSGESVLLIAFADPGWRFDHWEGDLTGYQNRVSVEINKDTEITAIFVSAPQETYSIRLPFIKG